jgi:hypothetical protein
MSPVPNIPAIGHDIRWERRGGGERNDFPTPRALARLCISLVPVVAGQEWCDPFRGGGAFFDQFPLTIVRSWAEIKEGRDFFASNVAADWLVSNPPYSRVDEVLDHSARLARVGFAYLLAAHALTPARIERMERAGFGLERVLLTKVFRWYGMSAFVVFRRGAASVIEFDRTVWRDERRAAA